jgi:hypothetical protein
MKTLFAFCLLPFLLMVSPQNHSDEFTFEEFEKLHAQLLPKEEAWRSIPWHANLISAQAAAIEQKKLIFIWSMDGHPLGCT